MTAYIKSNEIGNIQGHMIAYIYTISIIFFTILLGIVRKILKRRLTWISRLLLFNLQYMELDIRILYLLTPL